MNDKKYKAIIFDLDGTLLDTASDLARAVNHVLTAHGLPCRTEEDVIAFTGNGADVLMRKATPQDIDEDELMHVTKEFKEYYALHSADNSSPYIGIDEVIKTLYEQNYKLAVVSNKVHTATASLTEHYFGNFIKIAVGDIPGYDKKPKLGTLKLALDKLGVDFCDVVYVGDSEVDVMTAKNADMALIAVSWGFRSKEELIAAGAKHIAAKPEDILKLLNEI